MVCLKTEIDTTSSFSNLVVRILMVFAEFEREITSDRIKRNACGRSKRGLAFGGFELFGYRRDPEDKSRLLIDPMMAQPGKGHYKGRALSAQTDDDRGRGDVEDAQAAHPPF